MSSHDKPARPDEPPAAPTPPADGEEAFHWFSGVLLALALGTFAAGMAVCGSYRKDLSLHRRSSPEPTRMTLAELASAGPPENLHVRVTDFKPGETYFSVNKDSPNAEPTWIYVPLLLPDGRVPSRPIVWAKKYPKSRKDVPPTPAEGYLLPPGSGIHPSAVEGLPGATPEKVIVIDTNVSTMNETWWMIALGFGLQLLGVGFFRAMMAFMVWDATRKAMATDAAKAAGCPE